MGERTKSLLIYASKCVAGTLIVFIISHILNYKDIGWCLISVILVLSPDGKESIPLAFTRIKANTVGATVGMICLWFSTTNMWILSAAVFITLTCCYILKLDAAARSALAATIIIMLHEEGKHVWDTAIERLVAVLAGCFIALLVTFIFHFKEKAGKKMISYLQDEA